MKTKAMRFPGFSASRRRFGQQAGALVALFSLAPFASRAQTPLPSVQKVPQPVSFRENPRLDGWIRVDERGHVTVFTGKAELGQGILTALTQIAAEHMDVDLSSVSIVSADTSRGPNEGYTYGSQSVEQSGAALQAASAQARAVLVGTAARQLGVPAEGLTVRAGVIYAPDGRTVRYGDLVRGERSLLARAVTADAPVKRPADYRLIGHSIARIDLPAKFTGGAAFVQDMRLPGMLFGRVVRPPRAGANLIDVDLERARSMPGVVAVVRDGDFLALAAEREEQAIAARAVLANAARWSDAHADLPDVDALPAALRSWRSEDTVAAATGQDVPVPPDVRWIEADYSRPYLSQASIGPSCALAWLNGAHMTVWSHTQGAYPLRGDLAAVLGMAVDAVDVVHVPGSGCYGHNGADDVALDAALLARAVAGRPVKLQWMRDDEFAWAPISPAMSMRVRAALTPEGRIADWQYDVWSNTHAARPGQPGGINLLAAWHLRKPFTPSPFLRIPQPYGNGDRNAVSVYALPRQHVVNHLLLDSPIRTSSLRTLGAFGNIFAIESFMDELAKAANADPAAFRRAHLSDPRALAVLDAALAKANWRADEKLPPGRGRGLAYSRYKSVQAYAAVVVDVDVERESGTVKITRVTIAADLGRVINPDGAKNQIEGGALQALSWSLKERVSFDRREITTRGWADYPIFTFEDVPPVDIVLIDRPEMPSLGAGEFSVGPAAAALANAVAAATGGRVRDLPMTPQRVKAAFIAA
ncbi:molybdopterin cofactor-binding domain-containing protein [Paraburkholderia phenoliruptrix]|uniref:molybdopterin cofactor-binding domain-containing protein n=1 Tax=Paraburkholderia phenoliruptrix TaxID=252970 RepID=UPI00285D09A5|nr:molybdopterin cofactor-binding domain-containing protein [Paraburkholderia phenoliruptrix]MDR6393321.1 CO/xanthine dehydrogenase Mo-binding subunit [Paraburkholderia phenoliruptrix]